MGTESSHKHYAVKERENYNKLKEKTEKVHALKS